MAETPPDARTLEAIRKIRAVLTEYDLFAAMTVISPERAHWLYHTDASWSVLSLDQQTGQGRVRAKRADFKTSEAHRRVIDLTCHAIYQCRDLGHQQVRDMTMLIQMLEGQLNIEHKSGLDVRHDI